MQGLLALKPREQSFRKVRLCTVLGVIVSWRNTYFWLGLSSKKLLVLKRVLSGYLL
jgi:hypothetical protein